jgi:hypothetical protein
VRAHVPFESTRSITAIEIQGEGTGGEPLSRVAASVAAGEWKVVTLRVDRRFAPSERFYAIADHSWSPVFELRGTLPFTSARVLDIGGRAVARDGTTPVVGTLMLRTEVVVPEGASAPRGIQALRTAADTLPPTFDGFLSGGSFAADLGPGTHVVDIPVYASPPGDYVLWLGFDFEGAATQLVDTIRVQVEATDHTSPTVTYHNVEDGQVVQSAQPRIDFTVADGESGLQRWHIEVNGESNCLAAGASGLSNMTTGRVEKRRVEFELAGCGMHLKEGDNEIAVMARDNAWNTTIRKITLIHAP